MADKKISELVGATSVSAADVLPIVQGSVTNKVTVGTLHTDIRYSGVMASTVTPETITAGVVSVANETSLLNVSTTANFTLGAGTLNQEKYLVSIGAGTSTVTANGIGFTTISMTGIGKSVVLKYVGNAWAVIGNTGASVS